MTQAIEIRRRSDWPDARIKALRALFDEGLSHELIARSMGIGKGAVSAKIDRLGWVRSATIVALRPDRSVTVARAEARRVQLRVEREMEAMQIGFTLMELPAWGCRWPLGLHGGERTFCGCPKGQTSYCEDHERRSRVKLTTPLR